MIKTTLITFVPFMKNFKGSDIIILSLTSDPPGSATVITNRIWLEKTTFRVRCESAPGNPQNSYRWTLNGQTHSGPIWEVQATRDLHGAMIYCHVTNNYTETKNLRVNASMKLNVECKFSIYRPIRFGNHQHALNVSSLNMLNNTI